MDDAFVMCCRKTTGHLDSELDDLSHRQRCVFLKIRAKRVTFEQFCDEVWPAIKLARIKDRDHIRVGDPASRFGFLHEPPNTLGMTVVNRRKHLYGDVAAEPCVVRTVDLAHAACTDERDDPVVPEGRSDLESTG